MLLNAPHPQLIGQQYGQQRAQDTILTNTRSQFALATGDYLHNSNLAIDLPEEQSIFRHDEDASQIVYLVLTGGPKYGFRIRLLNDNRVIVSRVDRGPAEKSGLRINDELLCVNNVPLGDKPRSLLLGDPASPAEASLAGQESSAMASDSTQAGYSSGAIELSKLDFAYQLIRHSSMANKLVLTVKRFLNPTFARASVAATNLSSPRPSGQVAQASSLASCLDGKQPQAGLSRSRTHHAALPYRFCECYCENEGKYLYYFVRIT